MEREGGGILTLSRSDPSGAGVARHRVGEGADRQQADCHIGAGLRGILC
jgi:hypothetical protein